MFRKFIQNVRVKDSPIFALPKYTQQSPSTPINESDIELVRLSLFKEMGMSNIL